ncbi:MAG: hypothetical protein IPN81_11510 [Nitrosomonadales bacterium]|nr:hypothetical protein [Nitrosomonadales bacterium]
MEEFSKSLITIHRTLMLATIAILAFALSDDPAGEYRDALHAERDSGSASHLFFYVL